MAVPLGRRSLILLFLLELVGCAVSARQEFTQRPQYTEVNPAETAVLYCKVQNKKGRCQWQLNRKPKDTFQGKYEWNGSPDQGDCSLKVINATLQYDDGEWECQVTAFSYEERDELSSEPIKLVVRVPPKDPVIEYNTHQAARGQNLTVRADLKSSIKCLSHYGNPAARIKWYIDDQDVTSNAEQKNSSEADKPQTWLATSVLHYTFPKSQNGKMLRCIAFHEAYEQKSKEIMVILDVQYAPVVVLSGKPTGEVEATKDSVRLRCTADANPPAYIVWKKNGRQNSISDKMEFSPLGRENSGEYVCEAENMLGKSASEIVVIDVKYPPKISSVSPKQQSIRVGNRTTLTCKADGNPSPQYHWLHSLTGDPKAAREVGTESELVLPNITYSDQGKYVCSATNTINAWERVVQSDAINIKVYGPPQILHRALTSPNFAVEKGEDGVLQVPFCADPPPNDVIWEWGNLKLKYGEGTGGRYVAKSLMELEDVPGCYVATLIVQKTEPSDSRRYVLKIQNDRGEEIFPIYLEVEEPIAMSTVIGIILGCLIAMVIVILVILYAFRAEKWCFRRKHEISMKDVESTKDKNHSHDETVRAHEVVGSGVIGTSGIGAIPPDALYIPPPKSYHLPSTKGIHTEDFSEYDSMMIEHQQQSQTQGAEVVYADLAMPHNPPPAARPRVVTRRNSPPTEYARIQYQPKPHEQADI